MEVILHRDQALLNFSFYKDKERVLRTYREEKKAQRDDRAQRDNAGDENDGQGDNPPPEVDESGYKQVRVSEDFVEMVARDRTKLFPFYDGLYQKGEKCILEI